MTTIQAFQQGLANVNRSKRLVLFVWFVNFALAVLVALPLRNQLDSYIGPTVNEEALLQKWDQNWYWSYRTDFEKSQIAQLFNYSVLGDAPFVTNLDGVLSGSAVRSIAGFIISVCTKFDFSNVGIATLLLLVYTLLSTYFAGGFVAAYAQETAFTLKEFLAKGATYFGRFFRLFLVSLLLYYLFFTFVVSGMSQDIASWTSNSPSEMTPFVWYMVRNVLAAFLLALFAMWFDYAKIRLVVDDRWSALSAFGSGVKFTFRNFGTTFPLVVLLTVLGALLMMLYSFLEQLIPQTGYWTILIVFFLAQVYMFFRIWIKASFYGTQTALFQGLSAEQHVAGISTAPAVS